MTRSETDRDSITLHIEDGPIPRRSKHPFRRHGDHQSTTPGAGLSCCDGPKRQREAAVRRSDYL